MVERLEDGAVRMHRLVGRFVVKVLPDDGALEAVKEALAGEASRLNTAGFPKPLAAWQGHLRRVGERAAARGDALGAGLCNELGYHL